MAITKAAALALAARTLAIFGGAFTKRESEAVNAAESYTPAVAGNWSPAPTAQDAALDQLAVRVKASEVITTRGDVITGGVSGVDQRLALGTSGQLLYSDGTDVKWGGVSLVDPITTQGDLYVGGAAGAAARLAVGAANTVLKTDGTDPAYGFIVNANVDNAAAVAYSKLNLTNSVVDADIASAAAISGSKLAPNSFATDGLKHMQVAVATIAYTNLVDGVAVEFGADIPDNAIIIGSMIEVLNTFVGDVDDSSTLSIGVNDNIDIVNAIAISDVSNPWDAAIRAGIPLAPGSAVKLTAARKIKVRWTSNADAALTAGSMKVFLTYVVGG
jgi:hypothetical protein